jgi:putative flippase GtrA
MIRMFSRYLGVQVVAYGLDMGSFLLLSIMLGPLTSNVLSKIVAGIFAFIAHRRITFKVHGHGDGRTQLLKYALLLAVNIPLSSGLLALLLPWIAPAALAKFAGDVACVGFTFVLSRYVVFTHSRSVESP